MNVALRLGARLSLVTSILKIFCRSPVGVKETVDSEMKAELLLAPCQALGNEATFLSAQNISLFVVPV